MIVLSKAGYSRAGWYFRPHQMRLSADFLELELGLGLGSGFLGLGFGSGNFGRSCAVMAMAMANFFR